ncbi:MAG: NlpC/P60 family protein [Thermodesulfobacteriota bacterium]
MKMCLIRPAHLHGPPRIKTVFAFLSLVLIFIAAGCSTTGPARKSETALESLKLGAGSSLETVGEAIQPKKSDDYNLPKGSTAGILATAYSQYGKPYRFGGASPETGFDCAGFTQWVFGQHGVKLPRTSPAQMKMGVPVKKEDLRPGDLVFYNEYRNVHVGMYVGDGRFIDSPRTGYRIGELAAFDQYHSRCYMGARRLIHDPENKPLPEETKQAIIQKALAANGLTQMTADRRVYGGTRTAALTTPTTKPGGAAPAGRADLAKTTNRTFPSTTAAKPATAVKTVNPNPATTASRNKPAAEAQTAQVSGTINQKKKPGRGTYEIKSGDTIVTVAQRLGVSSQSLLEANGLNRNQLLRVGQVLTIPGHVH